MMSHLDGPLQVWNATAERLLGTMSDSWDSRVDTHVFSPDQEMLFVGRRNSTIMVYARNQPTAAASD